MGIVIFLVIAAVAFFAIKSLKNYGQGKRVAESVKEKAIVDYKSMRSVIRKWFKERNEADLDEALECAGELRKIEQMARFSRPQDVKTADQAMAYTYANEIARLLDEEQKGFDLDFDFIEGKLELYNILMGYRTREQALQGPPES